MKNDDTYHTQVAEHREALPFRIAYIIKRNEQLFYEGQVLSNANLCGMFICERGEVEVSFEEQTYVIHRGDMYIYMASSLVRICRIHPETEGFLLDGNLDFLTMLANRVLSVEQILFIRRHPCLSLTEKQHQGLCHTLRTYEERLRELYTPAVMDEGRRYAALQHISPRYFSSIIKEASGRSASQWIVQKIIAEAKALLGTPELSVKEIAAHFNFPTQSFFGKYFKHYVGCSPKAYRSQVLSGRDMDLLR